MLKAIGSSALGMAVVMGISHYYKPTGEYLNRIVFEEEKPKVEHYIPTPRLDLITETNYSSR